jgi:hypothetical protein
MPFEPANDQDMNVQRWCGEIIDEDFGDDYIIISTTPLKS